VGYNSPESYWDKPETSKPPTCKLQSEPTNPVCRFICRRKTGRLKSRHYKDRTFLLHSNLIGYWKLTYELFIFTLIYKFSFVTSNNQNYGKSSKQHIKNICKYNRQN